MFCLSCSHYFPQITGRHSTISKPETGPQCPSEAMETRKRIDLPLILLIEVNIFIKFFIISKNEFFVCMVFFIVASFATRLFLSS